jgi:hypothetical protein
LRDTGRTPVAFATWWAQKAGSWPKQTLSLRAYYPLRSVNGIKSPVEHQVFQRTDGGEGELLLEGNLVYGSAKEPRPNGLEARVLGEGVAPQWQSVFLVLPWRRSGVF